MTVSTGVGRGRKGIPRGAYSVKLGMKLCRGPLHAEGGEWLEATPENFWVRKGLSSDLYYSICRRCRRYKINKRKTTNVGYIDASYAVKFLIILSNRLGRRETSRRLGMSYKRLTGIIQLRQKFVERQTLADIMTVYREVMASGEYRDSPQLRTARAKALENTNRANGSLNRESAA